MVLLKFWAMAFPLGKQLDRAGSRHLQHSIWGEQSQWGLPETRAIGPWFGASGGSIQPWGYPFIAGWFRICYLLENPSKNEWLFWVRTSYDSWDPPNSLNDVALGRLGLLISHWCFSIVSSCWTFHEVSNVATRFIYPNHHPAFWSC